MGKAGKGRVQCSGKTGQATIGVLSRRLEDCGSNPRVCADYYFTLAFHFNKYLRRTDKSIQDPQISGDRRSPHSTPPSAAPLIFPRRTPPFRQQPGRYRGGVLRVLVGRSASGEDTRKGWRSNLSAAWLRVHSHCRRLLVPTGSRGNSSSVNST